MPATTCSNCGGVITYPERAFGSCVTCPACHSQNRTATAPFLEATSKSLILEGVQKPQGRGIKTWLLLAASLAVVVGLAAGGLLLYDEDASPPRAMTHAERVNAMTRHFVDAGYRVFEDGPVSAYRPDFGRGGLEVKWRLTRQQDADSHLSVNDKSGGGYSERFYLDLFREWSHATDFFPDQCEAGRRMLEAVAVLHLLCAELPTDQAEPDSSIIEAASIRYNCEITECGWKSRRVGWEALNIKARTSWGGYELEVTLWNVEHTTRWLLIRWTWTG